MYSTTSNNTYDKNISRNNKSKLIYHGLDTLLKTFISIYLSIDRSISLYMYIYVCMPIVSTLYDKYNN